VEAALMSPRGPTQVSCGIGSPPSGDYDLPSRVYSMVTRHLGSAPVAPLAV
jgi:hypothetical protein